MSSNEQQHKVYHSAIRNLQKELMRLRRLIEQDRTSLNEFKRVFDTQVTRGVQETLPLTRPQERTNKIPTIPLEEREEQYNAVQTSLAELSEKEQELAADLDHFSGRFVQYDGELARVYRYVDQFIVCYTCTYRYVDHFTVYFTCIYRFIGM